MMAPEGFTPARRSISTARATTRDEVFRERITMQMVCASFAKSRVSLTALMGAVSSTTKSYLLAAS